MDDVLLLPVLHEKLPAPLAVNVVVEPGQITVLPDKARLGEGDNDNEIEAEAVQPALFVATTEYTPDAVAVSCGSMELSDQSNSGVGSYSHRSV